MELNLAQKAHYTTTTIINYYHCCYYYLLVLFQGNYLDILSKMFLLLSLLLCIFYFVANTINLLLY